MNNSGCEYIVGFISRRVCGEEPTSQCQSCGIAVCQRHGLSTEEGYYCRKCLAKRQAALATETPHLAPLPAYDRDLVDVEDTFWDDLS